MDINDCDEDTKVFRILCGPRLFHDVINPSERVKWAACLANGFNFLSMDNPSLELFEAACASNTAVIGFVCNLTYEMQLHVALKYPTHFRFIINPDPEIALIAKMNML
jgi:hypothetical protein